MITVKDFEEYRSKKDEIKEIRHKLDNLGKHPAEDVISSDVILNYQSGYGIPQTITGVDIALISKQRSKYITQIMRLQAECEEVEDYIDKIPNSLTRRMARMYFIDGAKQLQIAIALHIDQSSVSRRLREFLLSIS